MVTESASSEGLLNASTTSSARPAPATTFISASSTRPISVANPTTKTNALSGRKSLRNLKSNIEGNHAALAPTMKEPAPTPVLRKSSSLFNLFSKPKVEKARGYGGEATPVNVVQTPAANKTTVPLKSALKPVPPKPPVPPSTKLETPIRPPSALLSRPLSRQIIPSQVEEARPMARDIKAGEWVPPPLFQAFARSIKHGLAEVGGSSSMDKTTSRPKTAAKETEKSSLDSGESIENRTTKVPARSSGVTLEESQKIVVLLESGHVLQYAQHGPTNRLPERVLQLGPESAAYSTDATSKQCAVRVVQNVSQKSFSLSHAFSRLTRRSLTAKRETNTLSFVVQDSQEMDLWLQALRKQIDGGRKSSVTAKDVPRHWQVELVEDEKENKAPSPIDEEPKPVKEETSPITALPPVLERVSTPTPAAKRESYENDSDDSNRKGSLELLEEEADRLVAQPRNKTTDRRTSDAPSFTSTIAPSVDQQALNNLRNSVRNSHISTVTGMTSRTNSITSEPSSNKPSLESSADSGSVKSPYKSLSSYQSSKRRSALPTSAPGSQAVIASTIPTPAPGDSPLLGSMTSMATVTTTSVTPRLGAPKSPPTAAGSDNKIPDLPLKDSTPPIAEEDERPESFVADLPPPSTWNMKISPKKRASVGAPMTDRQLHRMSSAPTLQGTTNQASSNRRASQAFRIPLKVNPDNSASRPSPKSNPRASMLIDSPAAQPKVFTLEAKVDPSKRTSIQDAPGELRKRTSQRLSLFPSPLLTQNMFPEEQSRRPSLPGSTQINPDMVNARRASLQRPTSLQVRTSHAPFLSSVRNQTPSSTTSPTPTTRTSPSDSQIRAAPIRSLKPSRSASAISSLQSPSDQARSVSPTDPFQSARLPLAEEDEGIHIPPRRQSYISKRTPSPASAPPNAPLPLAPGMTMNNNFVQQRNLHRQSMKPRNSLMTPLLTVDLGIPVIGLGPPAPPPNAPLPAPPGGAPPGIVSRGTTPIPAMSPAARGPILPHSNAIVPPQQRPISSKAEGLGIRVG